MYSGCFPLRFRKGLISLVSGEGLRPLKFDARAARFGSRGTSMIKTYSRWRFAAAASPLALAIATSPAVAVGSNQAVTGAASAATAAQPVPPPSDTAANPQATSEPATAQNSIVVTGFRAALRSA